MSMSCKEQRNISIVPYKWILLLLMCQHIIMVNKTLCVDGLKVLNEHFKEIDVWSSYNRNNDIISAICKATENALSIIYKYLSFNDILSICTTNVNFWDLSFKLISSLTNINKSINGGVSNK
eukprot:139477_1